MSLDRDDVTETLDDVLTHVVALGEARNWGAATGPAGSLRDPPRDLLEQQSAKPLAPFFEVVHGLVEFDRGRRMKAQAHQ